MANLVSTEELGKSVTQETEKIFQVQKELNFASDTLKCCRRRSKVNKKLMEANQRIAETVDIEDNLDVLQSTHVSSTSGMGDLSSAGLQEQQGTANVSDYIHDSTHYKRKILEQQRNRRYLNQLLRTSKESDESS